MNDFIIFEKRDGVGLITLNRPHKYNSIVGEMALSLQDILDVCDSDDEVRSVYLTGNGKAFCAGQDLNEILDPEGPELSEIVKAHYNPIITQIRNLAKPVVCGVNGIAAGAGANIALACDITLASDSAVFIQAFSKIGLIPDSGGTFFLPRLIGMQKATALMMLGDSVTAQDAQNMGMIYKVIPAKDLQTHAFNLAVKLAKMPTYALAMTKRALNASMTHDLPTQLNLEDELQTLAGNSIDYTEGVKAFIEKRTPHFIGK